MTAPGASKLSGVTILVIAVAFFGALDTTTKIASALAPVIMAIWARYVVQTAATVAVLWPKERSALFRTRRPGLQLIRALLLVLSNALAFLSLRHMNVGEFTAVVMLTPLLLTVAAALMFHEQVSWPRWACVWAGFIGTLAVIRPDVGGFNAAMLLPLLLVVASTVFQLITSRLAKVDGAGAIHLYSGLGGLLISSLALPFAWQALPISTWLVLALMGLLGGFGHFLLIVAFARAPVSRLTPYLYLQILFATLGGWIVFHHLPDGWSAIGMLLIGASGAYGTWLSAREHQQALAEQARLPPHAQP